MEYKEMKFSELKETFKTEKNFRDCDINLATYMGIMDKHLAIIDGIDGTILEDNNGVATIDHIVFEFSLYYTLATTYCNIVFEEEELSEFKNVYDFFKKNKFYEWLNKATNGDSNEYQKMYSKYCRDEVFRKNSFANLITKILPQLNDQLDLKEAKEMVAELNSVDPMTMEVLAGLGNQDDIVSPSTEKSIEKIKDLQNIIDIRTAEKDKGSDI